MDGCNVGGLGVGVRCPIRIAVPCEVAELQRLKHHCHHAVVFAKGVFTRNERTGNWSTVFLFPRRVFNSDRDRADRITGVIMGLVCRNDIRLCFRNSLDRCDSLITGGFDFSFRSRCLDVIFAGVPCIRQSLDAGCIVFALIAGIERSFDNRDSRISQLGNRCLVERFKHLLVFRLGNHLDRERNGAVIFGVLRNLVRNQIVAGPIDSVNACQRLRFRTQPCFTAVNRPDRPVQLVCCVQIIADKYIIASQGSFRQVARELPPVTRH